MRLGILFLAAVGAALFSTEMAQAGNCRGYGAQQQVVVQQAVAAYAVPVQQVQVMTYQAVPVVQQQFAVQTYAMPVQQVVVQRQFKQRAVAGYGYGGGGFARQRAIGGGFGGDGLGTIINRQNILTGVGAAAGAAVFPGAAPLGAAAGAILGNIIAGP